MPEFNSTCTLRDQVLVTVVHQLCWLLVPVCKYDDPERDVARPEPVDAITLYELKVSRRSCAETPEGSKKHGVVGYNFLATNKVKSKAVVASEHAVDLCYFCGGDLAKLLSQSHRLEFVVAMAILDGVSELC